jgi:hypothetical protein
MRKNVIIILSAAVIVIGSVAYYYYHYSTNKRNEQEKLNRLNELSEQETKINAVKSDMAIQIVFNIYDLTLKLPKDTREYFNKKALDLSISLLPQDTILEQLLAIELHLRSVIKEEQVPGSKNQGSGTKSQEGIKH